MAEGVIPPFVHSFDVGSQTVWLCPEGAEPSEDELAGALDPEEWALAAPIRAPRRRREVLIGRWLHHLISGSTEPLAKDDTGVPQWPQGFVGSISHKAGHVAYSFSRDQDLLGLGLDLEDVAQVKPSLAPRICRAQELALLEDLSHDSETKQRCLALIFSFKEALFKAHYPHGRKFFYFGDAEVLKIDLIERTMVARLLVDTTPATLSGHKVQGAFMEWPHQERHFVLTAIVERKLGTT